MLTKTNLSFELKMKRKTIFLNSLKIVLTGACFILFLLLMREGWEKFSHKTAHTGIRFIRNPEESKVLPCVSFCTKEGFKRKSYFSNQSSFLEKFLFSWRNISPNLDWRPQECFKVCGDGLQQLDCWTMFVVLNPQTMSHRCSQGVLP